MSLSDRLSLAADVGGRDQCVLVFSLNCSENLHRPRPRMGHQLDHLLLCRRALAVHVVRARINRSGVVVVIV